MVTVIISSAIVTQLIVVIIVVICTAAAATIVDAAICGSFQCRANIIMDVVIVVAVIALTTMCSMADRWTMGDGSIALIDTKE